MSPPQNHPPHPITHPANPMQFDRQSVLPTFPSGTFTITSATGAHRVVRIKCAKWADGKRVVSVKNTDGDSLLRWLACAFVGERELLVFRNHRHGSTTRVDGGPAALDDPEELKVLCVLASLVTDGPGGYYGSRGFSLLWEGRCVRCDRGLTDPKSIALGIGPVCLKRHPLERSEMNTNPAGAPGGGSRLALGV